MLKKDPDRRPAYEDFLAFDFFLYEKTVKLIEKCNWTNNETFRKYFGRFKK